GGDQGRSVAACGSAAVRSRRQHGDQVGAAAARDRQRGARPDGRAQAAGDPGRASHVAAGAEQGTRLYATGVGRGAGRTWPEGGLPLGLGLRARGEAELQKKPWWLASERDLTSRAAARNGSSTSTGSRPRAWSSSMRRGPGPTW